MWDFLENLAEVLVPLRRLKVAILKWPTPLIDSPELAISRRIGHILGESAISEYIVH